MLKSFLSRLRRTMFFRSDTHPVSQPVFDELVESIVRDWHAKHMIGRGKHAMTFEDFRGMKSSDARREACRILSLPPLDRIVPEWAEASRG